MDIWMDGWMDAVDDEDVDESESEDGGCNDSDIYSDAHCDITGVLYIYVASRGNMWSVRLFKVTLSARTVS
jgi:hypothetical protein